MRFKKILSLALACFMAVGASTTALATRADVSGISLGGDTNSGVALEGAHLTPGKSYKFPILVNINGETLALDEDILDGYTLKVSDAGDGGSLSGFDFTRSGGDYFLRVSVKPGWPADATEESWRIRLAKKGANSESHELTVNFSTGYAEADDDTLAGLQKGDKIPVNNERPVYSAGQIADIRDVYEGQRVEFTGDGWSFNTSLSGVESINMLYNDSEVDEIIDKYEDNQFRFLTFPAGTKFAATGTLTIDAAEYAIDFEEKFYVYRYLNGRLTPISVTFDSFEETLTLKTDTLGRFVITDKEIKDLVVVPGMTQSGSGSSNGGSAVQNPNTGAAA